MRFIIKNIDINRLRRHQFHEDVYESNSTDTLKMSFERTGKKPVYPIVVVPHIEPEMYWVITRLKSVTTTQDILIPAFYFS